MQDDKENTVPTTLDGLTIDELVEGDVLSWPGISREESGRVAIYYGEKVVFTDGSRCLPVRDIISSAVLVKS